MYDPSHVVIIILDLFSVLINYSKEGAKLGFDLSFLDPQDVHHCKLKQLEKRAVHEVISD